MVAALLLIVPGFVSDALGLLLLVPFIRGMLKRTLAKRMRVKSYGKGGGFRAGFGSGFGGPRRRGANDVVDLDPEDFERREPRSDDNGDVGRDGGRHGPRQPPRIIDHQD